MSQQTAGIRSIAAAATCLLLGAFPSPAATQPSGSETAEQESEEASKSDDSTPSKADPEPAASDDTKPDSGVVIGENGDGEGPKWRLAIDGYLRTLFTTIENDPNVDFVGSHDGFNMADARLTLNGSLANGLGFKLQFDGAVEQNNATVNSPQTRLVTRLKDAFISYQPFDPLRVSAGQFKPPFDVEEQFSNSELLFVHESVGSRGVEGVEGFNVDGLSVQRQTGLRLDGDPWYPLADGDEPDGIGASYAIAMTNGSTAPANLNDNNRFAYYGRANLHWEDHARVGGAYFYNDETRGDRPNLVGVETTGWTADLTVDVAGFTAIGSIIEQTETSFSGQTDEGAITSRAYQGQIAYEEPFIGLQPAYRYAFYDPTHDYQSELGEGGFDADTRTHHTFGLNYNAQEYPVRVMVNYTLAMEQEARDLQNNRLDALVQLTW
jgi:hypothetical protein